MPDYRLDIRLQEPFSSGTRPVVSNEIDTVQFIPATSLRGALASELHYSQRAAELGAWFGVAGPHWTPAIPASNEPEELVVPMPLCLAFQKGDLPFHGQYPIYNTLYGAPPQTQNGERLQWSAIRSPWLRVRAGQPAAVYQLTVDSSMHVGLHYGRQASRTGALFSRREIAAQTRFTAWVRDPRDVVQQGPDSITVGKRRSAGNGAALLQWHPAPFPWQGRPLPANQTAVNIQLITDAILPNAATGGYHRGIDAATWSAILDTPVHLLGAASASRLHRAWSGVWGLPRAQTLAIAAGSAYRLAPAHPADSPRFQAALEQLATTGLGLSRHEGFGWISVNPPWLDAPQIAPTRETPSSTKPSGPQTWPGFLPAERAALRAALTQADTAKTALKDQKAKDPKAKVSALAHYAARAESIQEFRQYLRSLAPRAEWSHLHQTLEVPVAQFSDLRLLRFFLQALETKLS